jgi:hypothetical protein
MSSQKGQKKRVDGGFMVARIEKVQERTSKAGKKYFIVNLLGDSSEYVTFDFAAKEALGKTYDVTITEKGDSKFIRFGGQTSNGFPQERLGAPPKNDNDRKYGTTLSYAKDILLGIITAYMNTHPEYPVDSALQFIEDALPKVHDCFLQRLEQLEKN